MKILFLPKYDKLGASSRYRTFQYLPLLKGKGISFDVYPLLGNRYLEQKYKNGKIAKFLIIKSILKRVGIVLFKAKNYDLIVIEKEIIPYFIPLLEYYLKIINKKYIVDYDDAIWHNYDINKNKLVRIILRNKIRTVMKIAKVVICGSEYIVNYAKKSGSQKIIKLPTVVDLNKYYCKEKGRGAFLQKNKEFVVGWIGSPATSKYILSIVDTLTEFTNRYNAVVHLIGFDESLAAKLSFKHRLIPWSESEEVKELCKFDVGIMPLHNGPFEKGKCGLKIIQYMACKKPVIASCVGENKVIVDNAINGFLVNSKEDWIKLLETLYENQKLGEEMGIKGYRKVRELYSLEKAAKKYLDTLVMAIKS